MRCLVLTLLIFLSLATLATATATATDGALEINPAASHDILDLGPLTLRQRR